MFKKLHKKIFNSVLLVIVFFTLLISAISCCTVSYSLFSFQAQRTAQNVQSGVNGCQNYFATVMGFVKNTAKNQQIVNCAQGNVGDVSSLLNGLTNNSVQIDGAILYGYNGYVAYSGGVGSPPSWKQLLQIDQINDFVQSSQESCVCVRNSVVASAYKSTPYNQQKGIVSVMHKVYDGENAVGILVADVLPETLYAQKLSLHSFGTTGYTFLLNGGLMCDDQTFINYAREISKDGLSRDAQYYCASSVSDDGWAVITFVPQKVFLGRIALIIGVFLAVDLIIVSFGMLFAHSVADSVTKPLNNLSKKMDKM